MNCERVPFTTSATLRCKGCPMQDPTGEAASQAQKHLTYYELDFGLNHVARKWSDPVDNGANLLIPVPGGGDGPGGVLVCADNFIIYKDQDHAEVRRTTQMGGICIRMALTGSRPPMVAAFESRCRSSSHDTGVLGWDLKS